MLVSIALCTYNGESFIEEQLNSILRQRYQHLEIIICDDASTDGTRSLLLRYAGVDERIKLLFNEQNLGPSKSFEKAIANCSGNYIAYADQDDIWKPEKVERMVQHISDHLLLYHDSELITEDGRPMNTKLSDLRNFYSGNDTLGFVFSNCVWGHATLFHRTLLHHLLPMPKDIPHDIWTAFVATCVGGIQSLNDSLVYYRQHERTVTSTLPPDKINTRSLTQKAQEYLNTLHWIEVMRDFESNTQKSFYHQLYYVYKQREEKAFSFPLFWFLLKNRKALFRFTKKSFLSQVNEIRKQARGIRID